jgi:hypothetical protein
MLSGCELIDTENISLPRQNMKQFYVISTYELCFGEGYFEYFESYDFSRENTNIDVFVFMFDLRMINMSSECEYE